MRSGSSPRRPEEGIRRFEPIERSTLSFRARFGGSERQLATREAQRCEWLILAGRGEPGQALADDRLRAKSGR